MFLPFLCTKAGDNVYVRSFFEIHYELQMVAIYFKHLYYLDNSQS